MKTKYHPLTHLDFTADFWEENPFIEAYFKTKMTKIPSSNIMWAITYYTHPASPLDNLDDSEKIPLIYDKIPVKFEPSKYEEAIQLFVDITTTGPIRILKQWESKLKERLEFIDSLTYSESTYEILDKMMSATDKMWKQYQTCLKDVEKEEEKHNLGGAVESLSEQGKL